MTDVDVTDEMRDEALAIDEALTLDRSPEMEAERVEATAAAMEIENAAAPSEEEVDALYTGVGLPEPVEPEPDPDSFRADIAADAPELDPPDAE